MFLQILIKFYRWWKNQKKRFWDSWTRWPPIGALDLGDLRRLTPISTDFGWYRGNPVDRYYIEKFLQQYCLDIQGRVLEVGDARYTYRFGGNRVTQSDVLHVNLKTPGVTIIADLAQADHIPSDTFDCFIMTQTLQLIYEVRAASATIYRILKPGGVLLATFPGICQIAHAPPGERWEDCWRFTASAAQRIFGETFPPANVTVYSYGNVLAATAFLYGLTTEELAPEELDYLDPDYEVSVAVRAVKP
ncbi:MAG TPA: methyltransferase domain-containing protein [Desulfobaccales bacterium]